jgi:hypothetical protein
MEWELLNIMPMSAHGPNIIKNGRENRARARRPKSSTSFNKKLLLAALRVWELKRRVRIEGD